MTFVWLGRFVAALGVNHLRLPVRVWLRWIAVPAVLAFVFVLCRTDIPYDVRLALSRAAMDQAAAEVMAGGSSEPRWIGLYPAESVERIPDGTRFLIDGAGFINGVGFAYSANGSRPADVDGSSLYQRIDGDWWLWIAEF